VVASRFASPWSTTSSDAVANLLTLAGFPWYCFSGTSFGGQWPCVKSGGAFRFDFGDSRRLLSTSMSPQQRRIERAVALVDRLGGRSGTAIAACKRVVYEGGSLPLPDGLRLERAEFLAALGNREAMEAMTAYVNALEHG